MQERVNQLLFPHIRVGRVFGYAPGQDVHSVELETVLGRKSFKESRSEQLPDLQHSQKTCFSTRYMTRFGIVALLKFAVKVLAPRSKFPEGLRPAYPAKVAVPFV